MNVCPVLACNTFADCSAEPVLPDAFKPDAFKPDEDKAGDHSSHSRPVAALTLQGYGPQ
jgi:hypothetical protein